MTVFVIFGAYDLISSQILIEQNLPSINRLLPDWNWQFWVIIGLALLLFLALEGIYRIYKEKASHSWILNYELEHGKLPTIPDYLLAIVPTYKKGEPISQGLEVINMSGQFWNNLSPSQKQELKQMLEWLGIDPDDYIWQMQRMLPKTPPMKLKWTPPEQK